jgi:hypothetical protein
MSGAAEVPLTQDQGANVTDICQVKEESKSTLYNTATEWLRGAVLADVMSGSAEVSLTQDQGANITDKCQVKEEREPSKAKQRRTLFGSALHNSHNAHRWTLCRRPESQARCFHRQFRDSSDMFVDRSLCSFFRQLT